MKKIYYSLFLLLFQIIAFGQEKIALTSDDLNTRFYEKEKIPKVHGQLLNYSPIDDRNLYFKYDVIVPTSKGKVTKLVNIEKDGTFKFELKEAFPYQQILIELGAEAYVGEIMVYDSLFITLDLGQLRFRPVRFKGEGVQFSGTDAAMNVYLNQFNTYQNSQKGQFYRRKQEVILNHRLAIEEQVKAYTEAFKTWDVILHDFSQQYPSDYEWILRNERDSDYYGGLFTLFWQKEMEESLYKEALAHQPLVVSKIGMAYYEYLCKFLKLVSPKENLAIISRTLREKTIETEELAELEKFLTQYQLRMERKPFDDLVYRRGTRLFVDPHKALLKNARLEAFSTKLAQLETVLADLLRLFAAPKDRYKQQIYYEKFLPITATPWIRDYIQKDFRPTEVSTTSMQRTLEDAASITSDNAIGLPVTTMPFDAQLYLGQGTNAKKMIAAIQNAFPGKGIILDVWATWCGPCLADMQRSKDKKEALKSLPVEVVYLCVADGSTPDKWENKIAQLQVSGNHIFMEETLAQSLLEYFNITGYPSHIFIDKYGNWDDTFIRSMVSLDLHQLEQKL